MNTDNVLENLRRELKNNMVESVRNSGEKFFKEAVKIYGVKTAIVSKIGKSYFTGLKEKPKAEIFNLCEELWLSGYMEESFIACNWSYYLRKRYEPEDFQIFVRWIDLYVGNWASCDTLCNHTVGTFLEMYPDYIDSLKKWAESPNRWMRRAASVSLIIPARRGKFLREIFEIAGILLLDKDDLVRKGYGWMLKAASESYQKEVFEYVVEHKAVMPRTALRYAIEKMPAELKAIAMKK